MKSVTIKELVSNSFLLLMPAMLWNMAFASELPAVFQPEVFQHDIPAVVAIGETVSRFVLFGLALLTKSSLRSGMQRWGMLVYVSGTLLYFASWLWLMYLPQSAWSNSVAGFMAPAYTPLVWLVGIALMGESFYFDLRYRRWIFPVVAMVFLLFHNVHAYMVYSRVGRIA